MVLMVFRVMRTMIVTTILTTTGAFLEPQN